MGAPGSTQSSTKRQVLVVEDHVDTAEMVQMLLEDEGYEVRWARTAEAALTLLGAYPHVEQRPACPDVILLDLTLPDMDAVALGQQIQENLQLAPPIIVLSAKPFPAVQQAAGMIGAADIVPKPFSVDLLLERIGLAVAAR